MAADTKFGIDGVSQQGFTLFGTAGLVADVFQVFIMEIVQRRQNRVRGSLPQSAEGGILDDLSQSGEGIEVFLCSPSFGYLVQQFQQAFVADAARRTFSAGFFYGEI